MNNLLKYSACLLLISGSASATHMKDVASVDKTKLSKAEVRIDGKGNNNSLVFPKTKKNSLYLISSSHINRIVTPFKEPSLKIDSIPDLQYKTSANVIYLATPKAMAGKIIGGFITDKKNEVNAIRLIMRPEPMPPQEIYLEENLIGGMASSLSARDFEQSNPRSITVTSVLSELAKGSLPQGYSLHSPAAKYIPKCAQTGIDFDFYRGQLVMGGDYVVAVGTVSNNSKEVQRLSERNCWEDGVVAVSSYPSADLKVGSSAEVFVMQYREDQIQKPNARKSLLD